MQKQTRRTLWDIVFLPAGCALTAFGLAVFTIPNQIAPGGMSGVATAVSHLTGASVGMLTLLFNVPLLLIAWHRMGIRPLIKTLVGTVLLSILIDLFTAIVPPYTSNDLFAALIGGVLMGAGMGLLLVRGISTGGTDLIGLMLHQGRHTLTMGQLLLLIDVAVVLFAAIVFQNVEVALYSVFCIAVTSKTIDTLQQGLDHAKVIYIVTDRPDALLKRLADEMGRGVTVLPARGGFSKSEKAMLMTIARRSEVSATLNVVRTIDPGAFTILTDATAVYGEGFKE